MEQQSDGQADAMIAKMIQDNEIKTDVAQRATKALLFALSAIKRLDFMATNREALGDAPKSGS